MKTTKLLGLAALLSATALTSCFDDNYDLSNIDTTVQVSAVDLVLPINIDEIYLKSIIDETEDIQIVDGTYAYVTDGTFTSDPINIPAISVNVAKINPVKVEIAALSLPLPGYALSFTIHDVTPANFSFTANNISKDVLGLTHAYGNTTIKLTINLSALKNLTDEVTINDAVIQLPKNLVLQSDNGSYDSTTGEFKLKNETKCQPTQPLTITLNVEGLNITDNDFNAEKHSLSIAGQIGMSGATFGVKTKSSEPSFSIQEISLSCEIQDFNVDYFDGTIQHSIDNVNIPQVDLNDLPDFLDKPGTNLKLANPCLYMSTNNPLQEDKLYFQTGLEITANRDVERPITYTLNNPIVVGKSTANLDNGQYQYLLSPKKVTPDTEYAKAEWCEFSSLGDLLSGNGLPKSLDVELVNPQVPAQPANKFHLGVNYPGVDGHYKFIAPFDLKAGSIIYYDDKIDGWSSDDLDAVTIESVEASMHIQTNIPVGFDLTAFPIDTKGNKISGVKVEVPKIEANANHDITISITGAIKDLDGIEFTATVESGDGELKPDCFIKLTNIRAKASAYYQKEL